MIHSSVKRWGNSPAVRIPATLMQALNLNIDDEVKIDLVEVFRRDVVDQFSKRKYGLFTHWLNN